MAKGWDKFKLLMWKNWVLQKRHKLQTAIEIFVPVLFTMLMVLVRSLVEPELTDPVYFQRFKPANISIPLSTFVDFIESDNDTSVFFPITISYSPKSELFDKLFCNSMIFLLVTNIKFRQDLNLTLPMDMIENACNFMNNSAVRNYLQVNGYADASALEVRLIDPLINDTSICGIELDDHLASIKDIKDLPSNMNMSLRFPAHLRNYFPINPFLNWKTNFMYPIIQVPGPRSRNDSFGGGPTYMRDNFIPMAHGIIRTIMNMKDNNSAALFDAMYLKRFPHPEYISDDLLAVLRGFISLMIMLSFIYTAINTVRVIAIEKEKQLKEVMKIMGLSNWLHWLAWFVKTFSYLLFTVVLIVILLKVEWYTTETLLSGYSVLTHTPWHVIFVFMVLFMITTICFCFMISTFFSKANTAATVAGLLWFLSYAPYTFLANDRVLPSVLSRTLSCLASNTAMSFGFEIIVAHEATGEGLQWDNIFSPLNSDDTFVMGHVLIMLVIDAFLYLFIALYTEQVFPGSYGVPRPWYFPVTREYWKSFCKYTAVVENMPDTNEVVVNDTIEPDPKGLGVGINIINLTKIFNKKTAVDRLSMKIFEDQITVLLGHNGAGKTTTMSMLTGILPPTSGTALIAGCDVRKNISGVRDSLGLCPQHNVLFADLTVEEHLFFYARLKGYSGAALNEEIDKYVELLALEDKRNVRSHALSGGMQRRLSVGCALCGGSRVVLLDEPSSGMDPSARRHLWDLLHAEKKGRTIILTTHFMDEAEILGERVAILAEGKLRCVGSPFYLKKKLGIGYRLTAARMTTPDGTFSAPSGPITNLLKRHIPEVKLYTDIGSELSYVLPEELSSKFEPMLRELETNQRELGLVGFGISASTLEEVFMRVGSDTEQSETNSEVLSISKQSDTNGFLDSPKNDETIEKTELPECPPIAYTGAKLRINQLRAVFFKKLLVIRYSWILSVLQIFIPVLFLVMAIIVARMWQNPVELPPINVELASIYPDSVTFLSSDKSLINDTQLEIKTHYKSYFDDYNIDTMICDVTNEDMSEHYLNLAVDNMPTMRRKNLVGLTVGDNDTTAWFSNFAYHDLPATYILAAKAIMKTSFPDFNINLFNRPLPFSLKLRNQLLVMGDGGGFQIAFNFGFSMAFVAAMYTLFYIKENTSRSKLLQYASGGSPIILWSVAFVVDIITFFVIGVALCITLAGFQQEGFATGEELGRVLALMLMFSLAMLPLHYIVSSFFLSPSAGFSRMCFFNVFTGCALFIVVEVLNAPGLDLEHIGKILHYIFLLFPHYTLCSAMRNLNFAAVSLKTCLSLCDIINEASCTQNTLCQISPYCCISDDPYFELEKPGIGYHMIYLGATGVLYFAILIIKEYNILTNLFSMSHSAPAPINPNEEDSDVAEERARITQLDPSEYKKYNLLTENMTKYYGKFLAVNQLTLGIKDGECFGLLGINGAGKTTTFKMLTGDLQISYGNAFVKGLSLKSDMKTVYKKIGYCPQFDALIDEMTGRQTLKMYSLLRGIPSHYQKRFTIDISKRLGFFKHLDKKVQEYSGGNKRKLSTSIALLGNPEVVYLDEPTTGMDPAAKRLVWNAIAGCNCVVLTSHSMEECEALCTRLAIMVNGKPQCLGSPQHLKNKFSQGYTLIIKLRRNAVPTKEPNEMGYPDILKGPTDSHRPSLTKQASAVSLKPINSHRPSLNKQVSTMSMSLNSFNFGPLNEFMLSKFPDAKTIETYQGLITYYLSDTSISWSTIFSVLEAAKDELNIEDYSVGQTSLEQIFLQFTKDQVVPEEGM